MSTLTTHASGLQAPAESQTGKNGYTARQNIEDIDGRFVQTMEEQQCEQDGMHETKGNGHRISR
ncbi:hypothetical protein GCM10007392_41550 [Saccharospirillum salsuginis]|uniref:Uncharacterized protein n=1 Tax=Saccharospirillum salsuginis TaxID=418750 RepID=A0A918NIC1_9GAMM|nr:hypothetical protein GCM10007392_41550 [Saccharospirillum salsuginis]